MVAPNEKLAASLMQLQKLQSQGRRVFRSSELVRIHRERLVRSGFLRQIMKGWLISCRPHDDPGDTTAWFAVFWEFCAAYGTARFGTHWHLSPEQSLLLYVENTIIPRQVIIHTPKGTNNCVQLLCETSLYDLKQHGLPPSSDLVSRDGLMMFAPEAALVRVPMAFFLRYPVEAQVVLSTIRDATEVLRRLLEGGHSVVAGRLSGAFRWIGRDDVADEILTVMKQAGYDVREVDHFEPTQPFVDVPRRT